MSKTQASEGLVPAEAAREDPSSASVPRSSVASGHLLCVCVLISSAYQDTSRIRLGPHVTCNYLILT